MKEDSEPLYGMCAGDTCLSVLEQWTNMVCGWSVD